MRRETGLYNFINFSCIIQKKPPRGLVCSEKHPPQTSWIHNSTSTGTNHPSHVCVSSFVVKSSVIRIYELIYWEPYNAGLCSLLTVACRFTPTLPSPWYQRYANSFMSSPFLGPILLLVLLYCRKLSPQSNDLCQACLPLSKLHDSPGQRLHRLLSRMSSGLCYCANRGRFNLLPCTALCTYWSCGQLHAIQIVSA